MMRKGKKLLTDGVALLTHATEYKKEILETKALKLNPVSLENNDILQLLCLRFNSFNGKLDDMSIWGKDRFIYSAESIFNRAMQNGNASLFIESNIGDSQRVILCEKEETKKYCQTKGFKELDKKDNPTMTWNGKDVEMWRNNLTIMVDFQLSTDEAKIDTVERYCTKCKRKGHMITLGCPKEKCSKCGKFGHWVEFCGK